MARGPPNEQPVPGDYLELEGEDGVLAFVEDVAGTGPATGFSASGTLVQVGGGSGALGPACGLAVARRRRPADAARHGPTPAVRRPTRSCTSATSRGRTRSASRSCPTASTGTPSGAARAAPARRTPSGVLLERILLTTRLPIVVFDPNSDFVRLHEQAVEAPRPAESHALRRRDVVILRPDDQQITAAGALHRHSPRVPRPPCCASTRSSTGRSTTRSCACSPATSTPSTRGRSCRYLRSLGDPDAEALAQRIENLGVIEWTRTWALGAVPVTDVIARRPAATVLDLGGYERHEEQLTVALAVLDDLWARRAERRPLLIVVDEAHNLCPPDPETPLGDRGA